MIFDLSNSSRHQELFNFYYAEDIINCSGAPFGFASVGGTNGCPRWQEVVSSCGIEYDIVAVFVNSCLPSIQTFTKDFDTYSLSGQGATDNSVFSEQSSPVMIHEIGHIFGLRDQYSSGASNGPNIFYVLEDDVVPLCRIHEDGYYEQTQPTDVPGGMCYYQLQYFFGGYSPFYVSNERSIMKLKAFQKPGFSLEGAQYLQNMLQEVSEIGYTQWFSAKPTTVSQIVPADQIHTISAELPLSGKVGETIRITVTGTDLAELPLFDKAGVQITGPDVGVRSLHILSFGDNTYADYLCLGMPETCVHTFTHTYIAPGDYLIRMQAQDSLGQGSNHKDEIIQIVP